MRTARGKMRALNGLTLAEAKELNRNGTKAGIFTEADYSDLGPLLEDNSFFDLAATARDSIDPDLVYSGDAKILISECEEQLADIMPPGDAGRRLARLAADIFEAGRAFEKVKALSMDSVIAGRLDADEKRRAATLLYWEPIMQRAAQAEIHSLNTGETARTARGHALDTIQHETGTDRTKASARYKKWRIANPAALPDNALH